MPLYDNQQKTKGSIYSLGGSERGKWKLVAPIGEDAASLAQMPQDVGWQAALSA